MTTICSLTGHSFTTHSGEALRTHKVWGMPVANGLRGFCYGALNGVVTGTVMIPLWGTFFGLAIGAGMGLILGFVLGLVTVLGLKLATSLSVQQARRFVVSTAVVGGVATAITVPALLDLAPLAIWFVVQTTMASVLGGLQSLAEFSAAWQRTEINEPKWVRFVQLKYIVLASFVIGITFIPLVSHDNGFLDWTLG